ncbi:amino acid ABC transporter substrate-binding protein [Kineosporia sp. J2-2]|uniref:Amino acid ABC transporter substrate-binding protein n=1 Tax=Kineosporia corallincola TaxID=2835133 RepID=A0ABS5TD66_9ACTN|nr:amino acid ABC transporter substrate-binding protein [Kineosporia corallincola]MBT0769035.1 amino acid ABC transporter substrate-binding protein [Kineosporia corallincola]
MTSKRFLIAPVAALMVLGLAACGSDSGGSSGSGSSENKEPLKVATEGTYAPFTFHDEKTNELTGYDVEVVEAVAEKLGREVEFSETTWDSIFAGLEAKRYDVIANQVSITDERTAKYSFSQPYTVSSGVIVTRADDTSVTSAADLKGKTSAQSSTSSFGEAATEAGAKVEAVEGFTQAVALLKQKRVDVTINDSLAVLDYQKTSGDQDVKIAGTIGEETQQAFAFRKDSDLPAEFDTALDELRADGTLAEIAEKYFGEDVSGGTTDEETSTPSPSES